MSSLDRLCAAEEQLWLNPRVLPAAEALALTPYGIEDIREAEARLTRFAPLIAELFRETAADGGIIESPLTEIPAVRAELGVRGRLFLKRDSDLPIAGSVKARGGIYEVLKHTEDILVSSGKAQLLDFESCDMRERVSLIRKALSGCRIQVGSTGNLGLSIGTMSAALGYDAVVHRSNDAKQWKKDLLRSRGVTVIEYEGDYSAAVKRGRELSLSDPNSYFVDDENSSDLFMGYAVAALRLKRQLNDMGVTVDAEHPLSVYLPCGVGGAPGGICFGLKCVFGDCVRAYFAEPVQAPCMLAAFLKDGPVPVTELGLTGVTAADGLAVGTASALVYDTVSRLADGEFTTDDDRLAGYQRKLNELEGLFIEPSSAIAFDACRYFGKGIGDDENTVHIAWATGGRLVPADERAKQLGYAEVVAALITEGERFMICKRPAHKARGGLWEFAGGKVEPGESPGQALRRECREELGIEIEPKGLFAKVRHEYPDLTIDLYLFAARIALGVPKPVEHTEIRWITAGEMAEYEFCPADEELLKLIASGRIIERMHSLADEDYRKLTVKIVPNVPEKRIIGVRIPELRKLAASLSPYETEVFLSSLPHRYHEENILHALILNRLKPVERLLPETERFLPYIDNWAVCDTLKPVVFKRARAELKELIPRWLDSGEVYTVRFGLEMLMSHFLDEAFTPEVLRLAADAAAKHEGDDYYIDMMAAWFFATALAKQYDAALPYIAERRLPEAVRLKTIRKACESYRVSEAHKAELRGLK